MASEMKTLKSSTVKMKNNKIDQSLLPAGYDRVSAYDLQWQSLHMAAAAACRGSTTSGIIGYDEVILTSEPDY